MSNQDKSGAAFPLIAEDARHIVWTGLSLRDYMAAKAMQGMCANSRFNATKTMGAVAEASYAMADAMLKARGQQ
jgi:hypothetical protein